MAVPTPVCAASTCTVTVLPDTSSLICAAASISASEYGSALNWKGLPEVIFSPYPFSSANVAHRISVLLPVACGYT